jgi:maltose phosphorylase
MRAENSLQNQKKQQCRAAKLGYQAMRDRQAAKWSDVWDLADITIEGDDEAQQAIRFNIFHLNQTFTGEDHRLNIGPKGFTGEKYGGSTYWDTEAYCIPFYMSTKEGKCSTSTVGLSLQTVGQGH